MTVRRLAIVVAVIPVAVGLGLILLVAVLKGVSNHAESLCSDDLDAHPGYGGYGMSSELWPPRFECEIRSNRLDPIIVGHPTEAIGISVAAILFPILYAANVVVGLWWFVVRRPLCVTPDACA